MVAGVIGAIVLAFVVALVLRGMQGKDSVLVLGLGAVILAPPLVLGGYTFLRDQELEPLRAAARRGRREFATAFAEATKANPRLGAVTPIVLYRALGPTLPHGAASAAALWTAVSMS